MSDVPGFEFYDNLALASPKYHKLDNTTFKKLFGKYTDKLTLGELWREYKNDKTKIQPELQEIIDKIEKEQEDLVAKLTELTPEAQNIIDSNRGKFTVVATQVNAVPTGVLLSLDDIVVDAAQQKVKSISNRTYFSMLVNDCDAEIVGFLKDIGFYHDFNGFVKQYCGLGLNPTSGYKQGLSYVRDIFNLPEPDRCSSYHFTPDNIKLKMETTTNDEFRRYLKDMSMEKDFDNWLREHLPPDAPDHIPTDDWYNYARKILGVTTNFKFITEEERNQQEAIDNIWEAVEIVTTLKPEYDSTKLNLDKAHVHPPPEVDEGPEEDAFESPPPPPDD